MIKQTVLPFNLEITNDEIILHVGLDRLVNKYLPNPGSNAGLAQHSYITPLVLMFNGGGRSLEDMRVIKDDAGLCNFEYWRQKSHPAELKIGFSEKQGLERLKQPA